MMSPQQLYEIGLVFDPRPEPGLYFPTAVSELLRLRLRAALEQRGGLPVLSGEAGSGKTLLAAMALRHLPPSWVHVAQLRFTTIDGDDLLRAIAHVFGIRLDIAPASPWDGLAAGLALRLDQGERSLLLVDDAQGLSADALRLLHRLSRPFGPGHGLLAVLLVGSPELPRHLAEALLDDIAGDFQPRFQTGAFDAVESTAFIRDRLARCRGQALPEFTPAALDEIHHRAQGVPGRINRLCRELLHQSLLGDSTAPVDAGRVAAQADQQGFACPPRVPAVAASTPARPPRRVLLAGLTLAALVGILLWQAPSIVPAPEARARVPELLPVAVPPPLTTPPPPNAAAALDAASPPVAAPAMARGRQRPVVQAGVPTPSSPRPARACAAVLTQLSLGEPLNSQQKQLLETTCR